jgi:hypothetical protein
VPLGHQLSRVFGQLPQQQEFQPGQRHRAISDVRDQPPYVQGQLAGPDHLAGPGGLVTSMRVHPQPDPYPGQELGEREGLGQVVLGTALQAVDLGGHVLQAGKHHDRLIGPLAHQLIEEVPALDVRHHEVQDDQAVVPGQRLP